MHTFADCPAAGPGSMSEASLRNDLAQPASGDSASGSDPGLEWAKRFDQGLKRASERILDWWRDPNMLSDDGLEPLSRDAVDQANGIIKRLDAQVMDSVVPASKMEWRFEGVSLGSSGEISLELASSRYSTIYRVEADGALTVIHFEGNRLIQYDHYPRGR